VTKQISLLVTKFYENINNNSLYHRLFRGGSWVLVGKASTTIFGLISGILLTRLLSPADVGIYDIALSLVSVAIILAKMGVGRTVIRLIGEARGKNLTVEIKEAVWAALLLTSLGVLFVGVGYWFLGNFIVNHLSVGENLVSLQSLIILIIAAAVFSDILSDLFKGFLTFGWAEAAGWRGVLRAVILSIGFFLLWVLEVETTTTLVLLITAISISIGNLFGFWKLWNLLQCIPQKIRSLPIRNMLSISWPILLVQIVPMVAAQSTVWILGGIESSSEVAIYGRVLKIAALISTPTLFYRKILAPFISELYVKEKIQSIEKIVRTTANLFFIGVGLVSIIVLIWSGEILGILFGEFYQSGGNALRLLLLGELFNIATGACVQVLIMTGHEKKLFLISSSMGFVSIAATLILVAYFGMIGAIFSRIIYIVSINFLASWYAYRTIGIKSWIGRPDRKKY
jgi:O-antigen/teichoic acid export membrane protein